MWRLVIGGKGAQVPSCNNHLGRQVWEFDPELGTDEERTAVERAREEFWKNRFNDKQSSDLLMRMQVTNISYRVQLFLEKCYSSWPYGP
jgi:lupeol synthase